jgi:hypothetical protein
VTDSNNARTLQRNIKYIAGFTHRRKIRHIKQGIDYAIANQLEYLTQQWPRHDQLSPYAQRLYDHGVCTCKLWATAPSQVRDGQNTHQNTSRDRSNFAEELSEDEDDDYASTDEFSSDDEYYVPPSNKKRNHFDSSMFDTLEKIIIIKVFSHQLKADFCIKHPGQMPSPDLFITSVNLQIMQRNKQEN